MFKPVFTAAFAALVALSLPAQADETWATTSGSVIYEVDIGDIAVLSFPGGAAPQLVGADRARVLFPGLGGNFENRAIHDGYWVSQGAPICSANLTTAEGVTSQRWGRARIIFDRPAFPTGFTLLLGACFDEPEQALRADLN